MSLPPVVCMRVIYVICVYLSLSPVVCRRVIYVIYVCSSLSPVVCRRADVLSMLFVFVCIIIVVSNASNLYE